LIRLPTPTVVAATADRAQPKIVPALKTGRARGAIERKIIKRGQLVKYAEIAYLRV